MFGWFRKEEKIPPFEDKEGGLTPVDVQNVVFPTKKGSASWYDAAYVDTFLELVRKTLVDQETARSVMRTTIHDLQEDLQKTRRELQEHHQQAPDTHSHTSDSHENTSRNYNSASQAQQGKDTTQPTSELAGHVSLPQKRTIQRRRIVRRGVPSRA